MLGVHQRHHVFNNGKTGMTGMIFYSEHTVEILDTYWDYSRGDVGHTNGVMARFLDMSWDLIQSVF